MYLIIHFHSFKQPKCFVGTKKDVMNLFCTSQLFIANFDLSANVKTLAHFYHWKTSTIANIFVAPVVCIDWIYHLTLLPIIVTSVLAHLYHVKNFAIWTENISLAFTFFTRSGLGTAVMLKLCHEEVHLNLSTGACLVPGGTLVPAFVFVTQTILTLILIVLAVCCGCAHFSGGCGADCAHYFLRW